jgi:hypothetical protein
MNGFHVAAGVGPKLEALGAIVPQSLAIFLAEPHTRQ